jgi:hypothetical protein
MKEIMSIICGTYGGVTCQCIPKFLMDLISFSITRQNSTFLIKTMNNECRTSSWFIMVTTNRLPLYHLGQAQLNMLFWSRLNSLIASTEASGVPSAKSSRSVRGLGKGVSGKPYPRMCNARRSRLKPGTFRSQAVRLYCLHQARPS